MSTVNVFVGQCGNQLGSAFLNALAIEAGAGSEVGEEQNPCPSLHDPSDGFPSFSTRTSCSMTDYHRMVSDRHFRRPLRNRSRSSVIQRNGGLPEPRCVLIDMEKQVISQLLHGEKEEIADNEDSEIDQGGEKNVIPTQKASLFHYSSWQCASRNEGSGNNWAFGYFHQGPSRREAIENCIRRELEASDTAVRTFHVIHSIAGGTGSGVGSFVAELIKELQPHTSLLHTAVWPFENGEVSTQWFNLCLTMSALQDSADAVHLLYNDEMVDHLVKHGSSTVRRQSASGPSSISTPNTVVNALHELDMSRLNDALATLMVPLHVPQYLYVVPPPRWDSTKHRIISRQNSNDDHDIFGMGRSRPSPLRLAHSEDVVEALALDPAMKFFTSTAIPRTMGCGMTTWSGAVAEAARTAHQRYSCVDMFSSFYSPRSCLWCLRGPEASTQGIRELQHYLAQSLPHTNTTTRLSSAAPERQQPPRLSRSTVPLSSLLVHPYAPAFTTCTPHDNNEGGSAACHLKSIPDSPQIHLFGATPSMGERAHHAAQRAEQLLAVGAYTHHYERYGVEKDVLLDAVAVTYDMAAAYCPPPSGL